MTTDITELAQSHELLIANGQQTADLLRHLADNEIDSDYFAVVSECESYGQETDAELSITEFAIRAAGYVDELVEALERRSSATQNLKRKTTISPPLSQWRGYQQIRRYGSFHSPITFSLKSLRRRVRS